MSKEVIDTINDRLIPLLNQKWRDNASITMIEGAAQAIVDSIRNHNIKASDIDFGNIESASWREHIRRWIND